MKRSYLLSPLLVSGFIFSGHAEAGEFLPRIGVQVTSHSNVTRGNESDLTRPIASDTVFEPYVGFDFTESVDKIHSEISFQINHQQYADNTFGAENLIAVDGFLDYEIVPGRFNWATEDTANTRRVILENPATPDNLQTFNVFTTGPDLFFTRGANDLIVKGRLGTVNYSDELADSLRMIGSGAFKREVSEVTSIGLNLSGSLVRFAEEFQTDYDIYAISATLRRETPWGSVEMAAGTNQLDFETGLSESQPLYEASLIFGEEESGSNLFKLSFASRFSDSALDVFDTSFTRLFTVDGLGTVDSNERAGTGATKSERVEANFQHRGGLYGINLFGFAQNLERPVSLQESQEEVGFGINYDFSFTENLSAFATYFQFESDFVNSGIQINGKTPALGLNWRVKEGLVFSVGAKMDEEKSNTAERGFDNDSVFVSLQYQAEPLAE